MADVFELSCPECGTVRRLDAGDRRKILAKLHRLSHSVIIECVCHRFQFVICARPARTPRVLKGAA